MTESSDEWNSEDDEQLSLSLSQSLSQEPALHDRAGLAAKKEHSDDSWASEDDEQLSQDLLSQQGGENRPSKLAGWVSPRVKLEDAMTAARGTSSTLGSTSTTLDEYDDDGSGGGGGSSSSSSGSSSETEDERGLHPLLRRCVRNELDLRLGVPSWRRAKASATQPIEAAQPSLGLAGSHRRDDAPATIGKSWTEVERHAFFRALRRCGKHASKISERVGTKSPIEVAVYLRQLHAASAAHGAISDSESDADELGGSSTEDGAEAEDAGDCRSTSVGFQPKRQTGRFPGGRCQHWPACEGDKPLPSNLTWEQHGWSGLALHERNALKLLGLNNLARYLGQKIGYHAFASYDSGAVLELHAQLVTLLASVLSAAAWRAVQRERSRCRSYDGSSSGAKSIVTVITLSDIATAAAGVDPSRYTERLLHQWASQPLPPNPFGKRTYRPVTERSAVWAQARPTSISIGNQQIIGPITALPSAPPSVAEMIQLETQMREGILRRVAFREDDIQRAVALGLVGGGITVGMDTGDKLDLTSPELLFLHHSILKKLQTRKLYRREANATSSFGPIGEPGLSASVTGNLGTLALSQSTAASSSSSDSDTVIEFDFEIDSGSDQQADVEDQVQAQAEAAQNMKKKREEEQDAEAAARLQEEAERERAHVARLERLAAQRADPAAQRAGFSSNSMDIRVALDKRRQLAQTKAYDGVEQTVTGHATTGRDAQDTGGTAHSNDGSANDDTRVAVARKRRRVYQPSLRGGDADATAAAAAAALSPASDHSGLNVGIRDETDMAETSNADFTAEVAAAPAHSKCISGVHGVTSAALAAQGSELFGSGLQCDSEDRRRRPHKPSPPVCFAFQWDKPPLVSTNDAAHAVSQQKLGAETHASAEFVAEWALLYQDNAAATEHQQRKRQRKSGVSVDATQETQGPVAPCEATEAAEEAAATMVRSDGSFTCAEMPARGHTDRVQLPDDLNAGINLLSSLALGRQSNHSSSSSGDDSDDGANDGHIMVNHAALGQTKTSQEEGNGTNGAAGLTPLQIHGQQHTRTARGVGTPGTSTAAKAEAGAGARQRRPSAGSTRSRSALPPWDSLVHYLLQHVYNNDLQASVRSSSQTRSRNLLTLESPASHSLRMLAESFLRRRWEQAIAAATHVRTRLSSCDGHIMLLHLTCFIIAYCITSHNFVLVWPHLYPRQICLFSMNIIHDCAVFRYQARRVAVLRADVALWVTDEISKRGAALQVSLSRRAIAEGHKLQPGNKVRIPFGKRAFARCLTAKQQARQAVAENSVGRVVSCANGYYTISLDNGGACKLRRSELELLA